MPSSSTLALGQATYELLDALDEQSPPSGSQLESRSVVETVRADRRGGVITNENIGVRDDFAFGGGTGLGNIRSLNIADATNGLTFNDSDLNANGPASSNANLNILRQADGANLGLGAGNNRLNAARDLTSSEVQALGGDDTVRVGGKADGSFISLGAGEDQLRVGRSTEDFDLDTGAGDDSALFLGTLTSSGDTPRAFDNQKSINQGSNIINLGDGDDKALFRGGVQGSPSSNPGADGYEIQLGSGNDTVEFGRGSLNKDFVLNTGVGSDKVALGRVTTNSVIDLGWDNNASFPSSGDTVVLGAGASLEDSVIRSGQSQDILKLSGSVIDATLDLGWGSSSVEVTGEVLMGNDGSLGEWDLGAGSDSLVFTDTSDVSDGGWGGYIDLGAGSDSIELLGSGYGVEFDLGNDTSVDVVRFADDHAYMGTVISNFGSNDILWIGEGKYGYQYQFLNDAANEYDLEYFQFDNEIIWAQNLNSSSDGVGSDTMIASGSGGEGEYGGGSDTMMVSGSGGEGEYGEGSDTMMVSGSGGEGEYGEGSDTMIVSESDEPSDFGGGAVLNDPPMGETDVNTDPFLLDENNLA